jgi:hypothetical protein
MRHRLQYKEVLAQQSFQIWVKIGSDRLQAYLKCTSGSSEKAMYEPR